MKYMEQHAEDVYLQFDSKTAKELFIDESPSLIEVYSKHIEEISTKIEELL